MTGTPAVEQFLKAIESAAIPGCDVWSADAIRAEYARWFADPGHFEELRHYQVSGGASDLIEYTLSWTENGVPHAAHHMHLLTVRDEKIVADTVFCGGRWPAALLAEMEAAHD